MYTMDWGERERNKSKLIIVVVVIITGDQCGFLPSSHGCAALRTRYRYFRFSLHGPFEITFIVIVVEVLFHIFVFIIG